MIDWVSSLQVSNVSPSYSDVFASLCSGGGLHGLQTPAARGSSGTPASGGGGGSSSRAGSGRLDSPLASVSRLRRGSARRASAGAAAAAAAAAPEGEEAEAAAHVVVQAPTPPTSWRLNGEALAAKPIAAKSVAVLEEVALEGTAVKAARATMRGRRGMTKGKKRGRAA